MTLFRPEYLLDHLRTMRCADGDSTQLLLPWLRTRIVNVARPQSIAAALLTLQSTDPHDRHILNIAVKNVRVVHVGCFLLGNRSLRIRKSVAVLKEMFVPCVGCRRVEPTLPPLVSLDLLHNTRCAIPVTKKLLKMVARLHHQSLRQLFLPIDCCIMQTTLNRFTLLEVLDVTGCAQLTQVNFCCSTLRVLYANFCRRLTDEGLRLATRLQVLHVSDCPLVRDVAPFAHGLLELNASYGCGITDAALADCYRLQVLNSQFNYKVAVSLDPYGSRLRELEVAGVLCPTNDAVLARAPGLVRLGAMYVRGITSVAPFGSTLREALISQSDISDAGLSEATSLVVLDASYCHHISQVAPFANTLLELRMVQCSVLNDHALSAARHLFFLDVSDHPGVTSVGPFARTLRHLIATGERCGVTDEGLQQATSLRTFDCRANPKLTTIEPFRLSLQTLMPVNNLTHPRRRSQLQCFIQSGELSCTPLLREFVGNVAQCGEGGVAESELRLNGFVCSSTEDGCWVRETQERGGSFPLMSNEK